MVESGEDGGGRRGWRRGEVEGGKGGREGAGGGG